MLSLFRTFCLCSTRNTRANERMHPRRVHTQSRDAPRTSAGVTNAAAGKYICLWEAGLDFLESPLDQNNGSAAAFPTPLAVVAGPFNGDYLLVPGKRNFAAATIFRSLHSLRPRVRSSLPKGHSTNNSFGRESQLEVNNKVGFDCNTDCHRDYVEIVHRDFPTNVPRARRESTCISQSEHRAAASAISHFTQRDNTRKSNDRHVRSVAF